MSITQVRSETANETAISRRADMKLEVVVIPVSDVDRAKRFYGGLGWRLDADFVVGDAFRGVQFTPPGSSCSIHFGTGITSAVPGSASGNYLVVSDVAAARAELVGRGVEVSEVFPPCRSGKAAAQRPRSGAAQLFLVRHVQRSGRQQLAATGGHDAIAWPDRCRRDEVRIGGRLGQCPSACGGGARRARKADRPARRELA